VSVPTNISQNTGNGNMVTNLDVSPLSV